MAVKKFPFVLNPETPQLERVFSCRPGVVMCVRMCLSMCVRMRTCVCVCVCYKMHVQRHKHTNTLKERTFNLR